MIRVYLEKNVFDAALERIEYIFSEFPNVIVSVSGGKDSTVMYHLALMVARKLNRLPLPVMFIDQEAEWTDTITYMQTLTSDPNVKMYWFQMPIRIFNATSTKEHWLWCWKEGERWLREKEPYSIKENVFGADRFHDLFPAILKYYFPQAKAAYLAGVRTEESPGRYLALTYAPKYKYITWGHKFNESPGHYTFYPIYDWRLSDVWGAIAKNNWPYNAIYDKLFQYGVPPHRMRVSNLHHETAVHSIFHLQEIDPALYAALTHRLDGVDAAAKLQYENFFPQQLPPMFADWREYRDYLLEHLVDPHWKEPGSKITGQERLRRAFQSHDQQLSTAPQEFRERVWREHARAVVINDWELIKVKSLMVRPSNFRYFRGEWQQYKTVNRKKMRPRGGEQV